MKISYIKQIRAKSTGMYPTANTKPACLTDIHYLRKEKGFGHGGSKPPEWVLDLKAEETITGRYTKKNNPACRSCGVCVPITGQCDNCD